MEEHRNFSFSEKLLLIGDAHFIRKVLLPLNEAFDELIKTHPASPDEEAWGPEIPPRLYGSASVLSGFAGIILFIGAWSAKKALDELYEATIKRKFHRVLEDFFQSDCSEKKYGISLLINKVPERISIVVATIGRDIDEIDLGQRQVGSVIARAIDVASRIAEPNTVHLYLIEGGAVNDHPWIYSTLAEAVGHMKGMSPASSVKPIRVPLSSR
jgi:hypothetical protein